MELARRYSPEAVEVLRDLMRRAARAGDRLEAAVRLLEFAHGKPAQAIHQTSGGELSWESLLAQIRAAAAADAAADTGPTGDDVQ